MTPGSAAFEDQNMTERLFPDGAVLVVGGSGGVGQAVCLEFARAGTDVALTYHKRKEAADGIAARIRSLGRKATIHQLTLGDAERVDAAVTEAATAHGRLHTVVVGAATLTTQVLISEMTREQWQTVVNHDLNGFYNVVRATLSRFKEWGGGSYLHLGSAGHLAWPDRDVMSVAPKAAIEALITGIAKEEGRHKIRANTVLLGVIEAGMFLELTKQGVFEAHWVAEVQKHLGLKRWGKPEEVGHACVFLASDRAAYVTGQRIAVAGGYGL
jgi:NAD(P)-dependent dehydrogenase (short-subunit alcohol dehydrogenase family)